jgi:PhoPQ-activated pathogenicity-related protein
MVSAMINISDQANQILNIIKAKYNLKDKSETIDYITKQYGANILEPELRPEYKEKISKIINSKHFSRAQLEKEVS